MNDFEVGFSLDLAVRVAGFRDLICWGLSIILENGGEKFHFLGEGILATESFGSVYQGSEEWLQDGDLNSSVGRDSYGWACDRLCYLGSRPFFCKYECSRMEGGLFPLWTVYCYGVHLGGSEFVSFSLSWGQMTCLHTWNRHTGWCVACSNAFSQNPPWRNSRLPEKMVSPVLPQFVRRIDHQNKNMWVYDYVQGDIAHSVTL
jgi:hypothetical protein